MLVVDNSNNVFKGKYLLFQTHWIEGRKLPVFKVMNKSYEILGTIKWYSPWRCYCFYPHNYSIYDAKCMRDIIEFIDIVNEKHKKGEM